MTELHPIEALDADQYIGQSLEDRYLIEKRIGSGAFAVVFQARDGDAGPVAIKMLHTDETFAKLRFIREIKVMQALPSDAHLVRYLGQGSLPSGEAFLVMEFVHGPTLSDKMHLGTLPPREACIVAYQIALALQPMHRYGLVHRDLKPGNVLIAPDGTIKLFDFGLVLDAYGLLKLFEEEDILHGRAFADDIEQGLIVGTPEYMALEQFRDAARADPSERKTTPAADIFSLGVILYKMISGSYPYPMKFEGERPTKRELVDYFLWRANASSDVVPKPDGVDDELWRILACALKYPPEFRYQDGLDMATELGSYLETGSAAQRTRPSSMPPLPSDSDLEPADEPDELEPPRARRQFDTVVEPTSFSREATEERSLSASISIMSVWPELSLYGVEDAAGRLTGDERRRRDTIIEEEEEETPQEADDPESSADETDAPS